MPWNCLNKFILSILQLYKLVPLKIWIYIIEIITKQVFLTDNIL